jgi:hypothetical protein
MLQACIRCVDEERDLWIVEMLLYHNIEEFLLRLLWKMIKILLGNPFLGRTVDCESDVGQGLLRISHQQAPAPKNRDSSLDQPTPVVIVPSLIRKGAVSERNFHRKKLIERFSPSAE